MNTKEKAFELANQVSQLQTEHELMKVALISIINEQSRIFKKTNNLEVAESTLKLSTIAQTALEHVSK